MLFRMLAAASDSLATTPSRKAKIFVISTLLAQAEPDEAALVVTWLSGQLTQRQIGVGPAALRALPPPATDSTLTVEQVNDTLTAVGRLAGAGSHTQRQKRLHALLVTATAGEQAFLRRLLLGDLRHGASAGLVAEAVAHASRLPLPEVRRAAMVAGSLAEVAAAALRGGAAALAGFQLQLGRPISPMLAGSAGSVPEAMNLLPGEMALDYKLDGFRVQVHRDGQDVAIFTRSLDDITARLPEVVQTVLAFPVRRVVLDGEVLALGPDGRPLPFQVTASRVGSRQARSPGAGLSPHFFDILHHDGVDLLAHRLAERRELLVAAVPPAALVRSCVTSDPGQAGAFLTESLAAGHEGVIAKSLDAVYEAGRRGGNWLKIKPVYTLDLVVLAVEWGSGRRRGLLSNLHLGARDERTGGFVMLGKTFKGLTDDMLRWQTARFLSLATQPAATQPAATQPAATQPAATQPAGTQPAGAQPAATQPADLWVVAVRPEQVVEVAFDGVQSSTRYPGGVALRFARVVRYRQDKIAAYADTIATVRSLRQTRPDQPVDTR